MKNKWRIAGLILAAILAAWFALRSCTPQQQNEVRQAAPIREQFHAAKPLKVIVTEGGASGVASLTWLERELRYLLIHGQMRVASALATPTPTYTLRVELAQAPPTTVTFRLLAPDGTLERTQQVEFEASPLAQIRALATTLPAFLGAAPVRGDWTQLIGTDDDDAYSDYVRSSNVLLGPQGRGFTRPWIVENPNTVDVLENLTRQQPKFARAWALLSVAYLSLGGKDESSLTQLADATAAHALTLDPTLTDAQAAQGLVHARRGEWSAALESFDKALTVDANTPAALEGLGCLLVDVGHLQEALPVTMRATTTQPGSVGARECLAYAALGTQDSLPDSLRVQPLPLAAAQVIALDALLSSRVDEARAVLHAAERADAATWIDPLLNAATDRHQISAALQAVTGAASDARIDPVTELICGAALRQSEFVFNRMLRLRKQNRSLPLRILWLPQTRFLREQARFEETVTAAALPAFWQDQGLPDICSTEPAVYGCKLKPQKTASRE